MCSLLETMRGSSAYNHSGWVLIRNLSILKYSPWNSILSITLRIYAGIPIRRKMISYPPIEGPWWWVSLTSNPTEHQIYPKFRSSDWKMSTTTKLPWNKSPEFSFWNFEMRNLCNDIDECAQKTVWSSQGQFLLGNISNCNDQTSRPSSCPS